VPNPEHYKPLVSIIVPSFNQGAYIRDTLESILQQDYRPIEILVIDGASTDQTVDVLHQYDGVKEVNWISEPDSGVVEAVNKGLAKATGEIAAIQSSDDCYLPGAISKAFRVLRENPELGLVFGDVVKTDAAGNVESQTSLKPFSLENFLSVQTWIPQPSTFFRLQLAKKLGGWDDSIPYAADTDLWLRMAFSSEVRKIDGVLATRRIHGSQRDMQGESIIRDYSKMIDQSKDLTESPVHIQKAAKAGKILQMIRYGDADSYWVDLFRYWRAVFLYPKLLGHISFVALIPGWQPLRKVMSNAKRSLKTRNV